MADTGSSPLTRGKRVCGLPHSGVWGLIPAHAGKTRPPRLRSRRRRAHPRSRGENGAGGLSGGAVAGSSPLTRGKPVNDERAEGHGGLIPAHAGKTPTARASLSRSGGSSPLTRGKPDGGRGSPHRGGLIPAHAGKTLWCRFGGALARAHPRSRGENRSAWYFRRRTRGSSPLTRGKPEVRIRRVERRGLIPAHAGKTSRWIASSATFAAHPRSRGENVGRVRRTGQLRGSSPLTRGKPRVGRGCGA